MTSNPLRKLAATLALVAGVACGGDGGSATTSEETPTLTGPHFDLTVTGPAFAEPQNFQLDLERLSWNVGSDYSFVTIFTSNNGEGIVSDEGAFVLASFNGGIAPNVIDGPGTIPLGETADGTDGWNIIIWPSGCPENYVGCDRVNIRTADGTMDVSEITLGESISRPNAEGPTTISATFEADAVELDSPNEGRAYGVEGQFYLSDN